MMEAQNVHIQNKDPGPVLYFFNSELIVIRQEENSGVSNLAFLIKKILLIFNFF